LVEGMPSAFRSFAALARLRQLEREIDDF
jgi:hypothetical protein